jgi:hypothetical protein
MRLVTTMLLVSIFSAFPGSQARAQRAWLISAGKGWGPIYLDMTEQNALNVLGPPQSRADPSQANPAYLHTLYYPGVELWFDNRGASGYLLSLIDISDPTFITRVGVRVGSVIGSFTPLIWAVSICDVGMGHGRLSRDVAGLRVWYLVRAPRNSSPFLSMCSTVARGSSYTIRGRGTRCSGAALRGAWLASTCGSILLGLRDQRQHHAE